MHGKTLSQTNKKKKLYYWRLCVCVCLCMHVCVCVFMYMYFPEIEHKLSGCIVSLLLVAPSHFSPDLYIFSYVQMYMGTCVCTKARR